MNKRQRSTSEADRRNRSGDSTNLDSILGRVVVEQGLTTPEEVHLCLEQQRQRVDDAKENSLAELLLENSFLTRRQLERVRREVEAQRSSHQIPGYSIRRKLGAGAMASVYLARQISLDRYVAIKVLPRRFSSNVQFIDRFYQEGRIAAKLNHPNIVQAFDVGKAGDYHYFVMEYVDGRTIFDDIAKKGKIEEGEAIEIILQMGEALKHAHGLGLVHRDVKPKNIMITKEGVAKLADMGLARALSDKEVAEAEAGRAFGTPYYISPEQIRGEIEIGPPADIYSLGATFYHMVTGQVPFDGDNPTKVMHKHLKAELPLPDHVNPALSAGVAEIIEMMMQKSRRHRYRNCADLISDLQQVRDGQPPAIAHKEADLTSLTDGQLLAQPLDETAGMMAVTNDVPPSVMNHPGFLLLLVLLFISLLGNAILFITHMT